MVVFYGAAESGGRRRPGRRPGGSSRAWSCPTCMWPRHPARRLPGTCRPSDLEAQVALDGSGGALAGHITVRNDGQAACTLSGQAAAVEPAGHQLHGAPVDHDRGPTRLAPGGRGRAPRLAGGRGRPRRGGPGRPQLRNWCGAFWNRLYFDRIRLPGEAERMDGRAPSVQAEPQCRNAQAPMEFAVGPFKPGTPGRLESQHGEQQHRHDAPCRGHVGRPPDLGGDGGIARDDLGEALQVSGAAGRWPRR